MCEISDDLEVVVVATQAQLAGGAGVAFEAAAAAVVGIGVEVGAGSLAAGHMGQADEPARPAVVGVRPRVPAHVPPAAHPPLPICALLALRVPLTIWPPTCIRPRIRDQELVLHCSKGEGGLSLRLVGVAKILHRQGATSSLQVQSLHEGAAYVKAP